MRKANVHRGRKNMEEMIYKDWLIGLVNVCDEEYRPLLSILHDIPFIPMVRGDEDRASDGVHLRSEWLETLGIEGEIDIFWGECSVLEMLIALSKRIEFQIYGRKDYEIWPMERIFWDLIHNLDGLDRYFGSKLTRKEVSEVHEIVDFFVQRMYQTAKKRNIFHFRNKKVHYWKMSIWDQMGLYLREKWPLEGFFW